MLVYDLHTYYFKKSISQYFTKYHIDDVSKLKSWYKAITK